MRLLVTAGNTQTPVDQVRCVTNVFSGMTGARIAAAGAARGHPTLLLTSHPEAVSAAQAELGGAEGPLTIYRYRTFDDLSRQLETQARQGGHDVIVHAAAVSDYAVAGVYSPREGSSFDSETGTWAAGSRLADASAGKIKSSHRELWLRLTPTPKLIDRIRSAWGFRGILVKFKLEVGLSEAELRTAAEAARLHSSADLLAANTFEERESWALLGPIEGGYRKVSRAELAPQLLAAAEALHAASARH